MDKSTPVLSEGILFVSARPSYLGVVFAIQYKTGSMVSNSMPFDCSFETPTIAHNKVYVGSLYALDVDTGEAYKVNIKTEAQTTITAYEDKVFMETLRCNTCPPGKMKRFVAENLELWVDWTWF